jgi:hypothetical protein
MSHVVDYFDDWGRPAWIAAMVVAFILFWPLGLGLLAFLIWSGRMGCGARHGAWGSSEDRRERFERKVARMREQFEAWNSGRPERPRAAAGFPPTGNWAFDEYRAETLKRLEEEAGEFRAFLDRLRHAKDKAEFDQFMAERRQRPAGPSPEPGSAA